MANKKISELPSATTPLDGTELLEIVQGGINKKVAKSDVSTGGGGTVESVTGDGVDNTDPDNPVLSFPTPGDIGAEVSGAAATVATNLNNHIIDTSDAHDASAISFSATGGIAATDVQTAIAELDSEKAPLAGSKVIQVACSDEITPITAAANKIKFRMPYAMTLTAVRASLSTTQTSGSIFTIDIHESGTTILSTKITIDNGETTSTTAATPPVISDASLADDAEISIDVDQIGDGTAKGLKITLIGS